MKANRSGVLRSCFLAIVALFALTSSARAQAVWQFVSGPSLPAGATLGHLFTPAKGVVYVWAWRYIPSTPSIPEAWLFKTSDAGASWSAVLSAPDSAPYDVWGTGPHDIFAGAVRCPTGFAAGCGAGRGGQVFHYDGSSWQQQALPVSDATGISNISGAPNDVYASTCPFTSCTNGYLLHYDGTAWSVAFQDMQSWPAEMGLGATYIGPSEVYFPTCWGHWLFDSTLINGSAWSFFQGFDFCDLYDLWGMRDTSGVLHNYVIGNNNFSNGIRIWRFTESSPGSKTGSWGAKYSPVFADPPGFGSSDCGTGQGIWGSAGDDVWAIGNFHAGSSCTTVAGGEGRVYHFDGTSWGHVPTGFEPIPPVVNGGVWGTASDDVWVALTDGRLLHLASPVIEVTIDIKPGSDPNCLNVNGHGVIPVAILGIEGFDVSEVDTSTLLFDGLQVRVRGNKGPQCAIEDVNGDALSDLVCQFEDDPYSWTPGDATGTLTGNLSDGTPIEGTDSICIVP